MIKDNIIFLKHILECIENIETFSKGLSQASFKKDKLRQNAIIRQVEIIGEAVKNLPIEFTIKYPYIEWSKIAGTRDKIIHGYFGVDLDIIWKILSINLPKLKEDIFVILQELKGKNQKT